MLKEYLEAREKDVVSIMMSLYDEEAQKTTKDNARRLLKPRKKINEISECFPNLSENDAKDLETEVMRLA